MGRGDAQIDGAALMFANKAHLTPLAAAELSKPYWKPYQRFDPKPGSSLYRSPEVGMYYFLSPPNAAINWTGSGRWMALHTQSVDWLPTDEKTIFNDAVEQNVSALQNMFTAAVAQRIPIRFKEDALPGDVYHERRFDTGQRGAVNCHPVEMPPRYKRYAASAHQIEAICQLSGVRDGHWFLYDNLLLKIPERIAYFAPATAPGQVGEMLGVIIPEYDRVD